MEKETLEKNIETKEAAGKVASGALSEAPASAPAETPAVTPTVTPVETPATARSEKPEKRAPREFKKNVRKSPRRESKVRPEFDQKIISIRRVTRVVTGGRRFSFSVAVVAGNRRGSVGVGLGKAGDTSLAIEKAMRNAKKNMITVALNKNQSIPHEVSAKYSASRVMIMPAPDRGIIAGSSVRTVLELAGIKDISAKIRSGSKNKINNARAAITALWQLPKTKAGAVPAQKSSAVPGEGGEKTEKVEKGEKAEKAEKTEKIQKAEKTEEASLEALAASVPKSVLGKNNHANP